MRMMIETDVAFYGDNEDLKEQSPRETEQVLRNVCRRRCGGHGEVSLRIDHTLKTAQVENNPLISRSFGYPDKPVKEIF